MLTIEKRGRAALAIVAAACLLVTGCAPPGIRALRKGDRLVQTGKYDAAIEALTQATNLLGKGELQPQSKALNLLGLAYHGKGNAARARACYKQALALDRNNIPAEADYNLGCLELEQTNLNDARDALTTYTTLRAQDWNGFMKLGAVNYRLATKPATAANAANAANADNARRLNFQNARNAFDAANRLKATPEAWNNVAMIDLALIDLQHRPTPPRPAISNVVAEFRAALACDTNYAPALLNLAVVYDPAGPYKFGDIQSAINAYHRYLALTPPPPHAGEIGLMVTNLDKSRMTVQRPGQPPEQVTIPSIPSTNKFIATPKTNPPPRATTPPPVTPPGPSPAPAPAASNPPPVAVIPTPSPPPLAELPASNPPVRPVIPPPAPPPVAVLPASNPPPVAVIPAPRPVEPSPPRPAVAVSASNTAAARSNTAAGTNIALASTAVPKPSLLDRLFGRKPKPTVAGADSTAGKPAYVTPLPGTPPAPLSAPPSTTSGAVRYAAPPVTTSPGNRAEAERLVSEGAAAEKESRAKEAIAGYEAAVKADPSYYEACESLGIAAIKSGEYAIALEALHHALALNSESVNARYGYAWTLQKKEYNQDAANELEKLLAQHPDETRAHLLLGNLYAQKLGQPDFARGHYKKVLEQDPRNDQAPALRAWLQNNPEP